MAKNRQITQVSTTAITVATEAGYGKNPEIINLSKSPNILRSQWQEAVQAVGETFFTESGSAKCVLQELEIAGELKIEGGFRFLLSGNLSVTGALHAKFKRRD